MLIIIIFILKKELIFSFFFYFVGCLRAFSVGTQLNAKSTKTVPDRTGKNIVLVDGVRTPFLQSFTDYTGLMPHELARQALL